MSQCGEAVLSAVSSFLTRIARYTKITCARDAAKLVSTRNMFDCEHDYLAACIITGEMNWLAVLNRRVHACTQALPEKPNPEQSHSHCIWWSEMVSRYTESFLKTNNCDVKKSWYISEYELDRQKLCDTFSKLNFLSFAFHTWRQHCKYGFLTVYFVFFCHTVPTLGADLLCMKQDFVNLHYSIEPGNQLPEI